MIIEIVEKLNGVYFKKHYSDSNYKIKKVGTNEIYVEAYDVLDSNYTYEETDKLIESE